MTPFALALAATTFSFCLIATGVRISRSSRKEGAIALRCECATWNADDTTLTELEQGIALHCVECERPILPERYERRGAQQ